MHITHQRHILVKILSKAQLLLFNCICDHNQFYRLDLTSIFQYLIFSYFIMKAASEPSSNEFYSGLAGTLKQRFNKQFNQYHRKYLQKKMKCYEKGASGSTPAQPQEYYACIETVQLQMKANSQKLAQNFGGLEAKDRDCQSICRKSFDSGEKLNQCISKCFSKYSESANKIYSQYYEETLK